MGRMLIRTVAFYAVILALIGCSQRQNEYERPNIILINIDDVGYGEFGVYGQTKIKTPRIDRMAAEGVMFTDFYAAAPVCGPSRSALLTGFHNGHQPIKENELQNLTGNFVVWPQLIRQAGYRTAMFGKQHSAILKGDSVIGDSPVERGFDQFVGWLNAIDAHQSYLDGKTNGWKRRDFLFASNEKGDIVKHKIPAKRFTQKEFMSHALNFLEQRKNEPFFLYLPFTIAHAEHIVPRKGEPDFDPKEDTGILEQYLDVNGKSIFSELNYQGDTIYARPNPYMSRAAYAASISWLDRDIGKILDKLKDLDIDENTIVIVTSDNGPSDEGGVDDTPFNGTLESPFNSAGLFKGYKGSLYEGGIRVPMIIRWPGKVKEGSIIQQALANYDIGPTILDVLKIEPLQGADGKSFLSLLKEGEQASIHDHLYFEFLGKQAVRKGKWKAYRPFNKSENDDIELYDLEKDPQEKDNLADLAGNNAIVRDMKRIMNQESKGKNSIIKPFKI